jgi:hypothetical protein
MSGPGKETDGEVSQEVPPAADAPWAQALTTMQQQGQALMAIQEQLRDMSTRMATYENRPPPSMPVTEAPSILGQPTDAASSMHGKSLGYDAFLASAAAPTGFAIPSQPLASSTIASWPLASLQPTASFPTLARGNILRLLPF